MALWDILFEPGILIVESLISLVFINFTLFFLFTSFSNGHEADLDFAKEFAHKINNFDKI